MKELKINSEAGKYLEPDHIIAWLHNEVSIGELYYYFWRKGMHCSLKDFEDAVDTIATNFYEEDNDDEMPKMWWKE